MSLVYKYVKKKLITGAFTSGCMCHITWMEMNVLSLQAELEPQSPLRLLKPCQ